MFFLSWSGWIGCILLSWLSFCILYRKSKAENEDPKMRDRLYFLMCYDMCVFALCCVIIAVAAALGADFWLFAFWAKCLYGVLAFPWIPVGLPLVDELIAHARATGYTRLGKCRVKNFKKTDEEPEDGTEGDGNESDGAAKKGWFRRVLGKD